MAVKTYDFKKVICTVAGIPIFGFIDGDAIVVAKSEDEWSMTAGNDGEVTRVKMNHPEGTITLRLQNSSSLNSVLDGLRELDDLSGLAMVPILIKDLFGTTLVFCEQAWCIKSPDISIARDVSPREWVYQCGDLKMTQGGNF
jgi:hypothetical protein